MLNFSNEKGCTLHWIVAVIFYVYTRVHILHACTRDYSCVHVSTRMHTYFTRVHANFSTFQFNYTWVHILHACTCDYSCVHVTTRIHTHDYTCTREYTQVFPPFNSTTNIKKILKLKYIAIFYSNTIQIHCNFILNYDSDTWLMFQL